MGKQYRIKVTGDPKPDIDFDLLAQVILAMAEERLEQEGDNVNSGQEGDEQ